MQVMDINKKLNGQEVLLCLMVTDAMEVMDLADTAMELEEDSP